MRKVVIVALALLAVAGAQTHAQTIGPTEPARANTTDPNSASRLTSAERSRIKEYVVQEHVPAVTMQERVRVGSRLPADIELRSVPSDWGPSVSRYRYVYSNDRVYLVDPGDRTIVQEID